MPHSPRESWTRLLAELVVIVVGVLIALFAEDAWSDARDRERARDYLDRVAVEVRTNSHELGEDRNWATQVCSSTESSIERVDDGRAAAEPSRLLRLLVSASMYRQPRYLRATYDDLIATGGLALIDDGDLRAEIVGSYTDLFQGLDAWRPPRDNPLRTVVLRAVPREFVERVIQECITTADGDGATPTLRDCATEPLGIDASRLLERLLGEPDLRGHLVERAYQACNFSSDMDDTRERLGALATRLGAPEPEGDGELP